MRGGKRRKTEVAATRDRLKAPYALDNRKDRDKCRALCMDLEDDELRRRLEKSRWNFQGTAKKSLIEIRADRALDDYWLLEAADTYDISHRTNSGVRLQRDVLEDVMKAVRRARVQESVSVGTAALQDARRRAELRERLRTASDVWKRAKELAVPITNGSWRCYKQQLLMCDCREELRIAVVAEFVAKEKRLPDECVEAEALVAAYAKSALARRYVSDEAHGVRGEQLSSEWVAQWQAVLDELPQEGQPGWQEDPVLVAAKEFFEAHGDLNVPRMSKRRDRSDAQRLNDSNGKLRADLMVLRKAYHQDQWKARKEQGSATYLLRRQLSAEQIATWEDALPKDQLWQPARVKDGMCLALRSKVRGRSFYESRREKIAGKAREPSRRQRRCDPYDRYVGGQDSRKKHWRT